VVVTAVLVCPVKMQSQVLLCVFYIVKKRVQGSQAAGVISREPGRDGQLESLIAACRCLPGENTG